MTENRVLIRFSRHYQNVERVFVIIFCLLFAFLTIPRMWSFDRDGSLKITLSLSIINWRHGWSSVHVCRNCRCLRSVYRTFVCSKGKKVFTRIQVSNRRVQIWAFRNQSIIGKCRGIQPWTNPSQVFLNTLRKVLYSNHRLYTPSMAHPLVDTNS
jgi:hypothetical protein